MKSECLKNQIYWDRSRIAIHNRMWHIPDGCRDESSFSFPGWSDPIVFDQERPICVEYCSGNGAWIVAKAQANPEYNWVAIEKKFARARKIWSRSERCSLKNLLSVCGEGHRMTRLYIPSSSVKEVFINFPDPWPKQRHSKNRLIQTPFVQEINRILLPDGTLTMVTDDESYSQIMIEVLLNNSSFKSLFDEPYYVNDYPAYGTSYFEELWRQKGKTIRYHAFRKILFENLN